jgi:hypothetical protein
MRLTMERSLPSQKLGEVRDEVMTFGTCQVRDARVVFAHMETVIRTDTYRSSQVLIWLGFAILVGLFGLGYFLYHHPQIEIPHFVGRLASVVFGAALIGRYRCCPKLDRRLCATASFETPAALATREQIASA